MFGESNQTIILDIDETLVHTYEDIKGFKELLKDNTRDGIKAKNKIYQMTLIDVGEPIGSGDVWTMWGVERNGLQEFIDYCFKRFENVIIWSAGQQRYVNRLTERIFRKSKFEPTLVLHWDDCYYNEKTGEYSKPIEYISKKHKIPNVTLENTFIVDDRALNFENCNNDNGLLIPKYHPGNTKEDILSHDDALKKLIFWFDTPSVKKSKDVRKLKKNIW